MSEEQVQHQAGVVYDPMDWNRDYCWQPTCSCGWKFGEHYLTSRRAQQVAKDHADTMTAEVVDAVGHYALVRNPDNGLFTVVSTDLKNRIRFVKWQNEEGARYALQQTLVLAHQGTATKEEES